MFRMPPALWAGAIRLSSVQQPHSRCSFLACVRLRLDHSVHWGLLRLGTETSLNCFTKMPASSFWASSYIMLRKFPVVYWLENSCSGCFSVLSFGAHELASRRVLVCAACFPSCHLSENGQSFCSSKGLEGKRSYWLKGSLTPFWVWWTVSPV